MIYIISQNPQQSTITSTIDHAMMVACICTAVRMTQPDIKPVLTESQSIHWGQNKMADWYLQEDFSKTLIFL